MCTAWAVYSQSVGAQTLLQQCVEVLLGLVALSKIRKVRNQFIVLDLISFDD